LREADAVLPISARPQRSTGVRGAPPAALVPLMRRTIENGFELTGSIARGDWQTVEGHLVALRARAPELEQLYTALGEATKT